MDPTKIPQAKAFTPQDESDPLSSYSPQNKPEGSNNGFLRSLGSHLADFIQTVVVFGAIFALIYLFVAQPHKVSGLSMFPTFNNGDYILTDKLTYRFNQPQRGDVIVLKNPRDESQDFIKRIIGLPGETIKIANDKVLINGKVLEEDYLPNRTTTPSGNFLGEDDLIKIPENHYMVIGDNRPHSSDSREWGGVTKQEIIGKVLFRYWPPQSFGLIKHRPSD
ncbi:signal peptidase I [Candidatus Daviesbacteria bacterium]|nr:signal peptidase I [Candidatus Daviesbacteria bacterium]